MRIAFLLTQSLESPSGLGRFWPIAKELVRLGHSVTILALHHNLDQCGRRRFSRNGVRVHYVGQMHVRKQGPRKFYFRPERLLVNVLASSLKMAHALNQTDAELIQLCKAQPTNSLAAHLGRRGRPVFCDCDDYEAETNKFGGSWQQAVVRHFEDGVVRFASGLTVNTRFTQARYADLGFPADRIVYVPNGVERSRFVAVSDPALLRRKWGIHINDPLVVYVGTLGLRTHPIDLLLEAFQRVTQEMPSTRLLLVGGGEDYDQVCKMARHLGIADQTIFTGYVPAEEVPGYFALGTVSVDPIRNDVVARARSPLKVVESLAMGVPVVTADVGDRNYMLGDGDAGVLVSPDDSQALAQGLLAVLQDRGTRARMAEAALLQRERWYWDLLIDDFVQVYSSA